MSTLTGLGRRGSRGGGGGRGRRCRCKHNTFNKSQHLKLYFHLKRYECITFSFAFTLMVTVNRRVRMGVRKTAREGMTVEVGACEGKRV